MDRLDALENDSIYILREAYHRFPKAAVLWSIGKDSTTLLWLCRKAFLGDIPFRVIHIDTGYKFSEIYRFRDEYAPKWRLNLITEKNAAAMADGMAPAKGKLECCNALKTDTLKSAVLRHDLKAVILGIRRDEHGIRAKERFFSPRDTDFAWNYGNQPPELWNIFSPRPDSCQHFRVHPLLAWREIDVWEYVEREGIPVVSLYFAKNGLRYRSIGCEPCCAPSPSKADTLKKIIHELRTTRVSERNGRAQDKEDSYTMQKLRSLGYM